jgi:hypothetical protein
MDIAPPLDPATPAAPYFVPQEGAYPELQEHFRAVHSLEGERRRAAAVVTFGGWALAAVFGGYALVAGIQNINRPAPRDRFEIAFVHDDGSYDAPREITELTPVQQREVLQTSLVNYITWRAGFSFAASQKAYNIISAMTNGHEQSRYQQLMLNRNDPVNPLVKYGLNGQLVALDIRLDPDPNGPNSWNFSYTQRELVSDAPPHDTPMRGSLTFVRGPVPQKIRVPFDPASIVVLQYESHEVTR